MTNRFLRPTSNGYEIHVDGWQLDLFIQHVPQDSLDEYIVWDLDDGYAVLKSISLKGAAQEAANYDAAKQADRDRQQDAEIWAEGASVRYAENSSWAEYEAFDAWERSMGCYS